MKDDSFDDRKYKAYMTVMMEALAEKCGPNLHVVEAFLAGVSIAGKFAAMLEVHTRSHLCDVVEESFRDDVEQMANEPGARAGVTKLQ